MKAQNKYKKYMNLIFALLKQSKQLNNPILLIFFKKILKT